MGPKLHFWEKTKLFGPAGPGGAARAMPPRKPAARREVQNFLVHLAQALHRYGMPAHRLEASLVRICRRLGLEAQFLVTPTSILASFGALESQKVHLIRMEPGEIDLTKLANLNELIQRVTSGKTGALAASNEVKKISDAPHPYGGVVRTASFAVCSGTATIFFGGGLPEVLTAAAIGLAIGLLAALTEGWERGARLFPVLSALVASTFAAVVAHKTGALFPFIPTLAGLIVLLPGLTLTVAMNELANGHLVSGSARMIGALVLFLQLGVGVVCGNYLGVWWFGAIPSVEPTPLPQWAQVLGLMLTAASVTVLFRARLKDFVSILVAAALTLATSIWASEAMGPELGIAAGAMVLGTLSNFYARLRRQPSAITIIPAMLLIVPGSLGFRSLEALLQNDVLGGIETAFKMVLMAVALVTGLFLSNLLVPPSRGDI